MCSARHPCSPLSVPPARRLALRPAPLLPPTSPRHATPLDPTHRPSAPASHVSPRRNTPRFAPTARPFRLYYPRPALQHAPAVLFQALPHCASPSPDTTLPPTPPPGSRRVSALLPYPPCQTTRPHRDTRQASKLRPWLEFQSFPRRTTKLRPSRVFQSLPRQTTSLRPWRVATIANVPVASLCPHLARPSRSPHLAVRTASPSRRGRSRRPRRPRHARGCTSAHPTTTLAPRAPAPTSFCPRRAASMRCELQRERPALPLSLAHARDVHCCASSRLLASVPATPRATDRRLRPAPPSPRAEQRARLARRLACAGKYCTPACECVCVLHGEGIS